MCVGAIRYNFGQKWLLSSSMRYNLAMTTATKRPKSKMHKRINTVRPIKLDRRRRPDFVPDDQVIEARLRDLLDVNIYKLTSLYQQAGCRQRLLTLPVMVAVLLALIWRQLSSVSGVVRVLNQQGLFWQEPVQVTQQAVSKRLNKLPASLFHSLLSELLPLLHQQWTARKRPLPAVFKWAQVHYGRVLAVDGSKLDTLWRKLCTDEVGSQGNLAGKMTALLDVRSRLPLHIWYDEDAKRSDNQAWPQIKAALQADDLLLLDRGYYDFGEFAALSAQGVWFVSRTRSDLVYEVEQKLVMQATVRDRVVRAGSPKGRNAPVRLRLIEVQTSSGSWYSYLTNVLEPAKLPPTQIAAMYGQRWRIEESFSEVKRLLGLSYFYSGSSNGVQLQLWLTWLLYALLVDLCDEVAEELGIRSERVSMEMVYRSLPHYSWARQRDPSLEAAKYLATHAKLLGLVKRRGRKVIELAEES